MRWFRSHVSFGALSALFALVVQLALSFGHVHLDGFGRGKAGLAQSVRLALQTPVLPDAPALSTQPAQPESNGAIGDFCALCTLTKLAGTLVLAAAPSLPVPLASAAVPLPFDAERAIAAIP